MGVFVGWVTIMELSKITPCPCDGCNKRHQDCHSDCAKYKIYRLLLDKHIERRRKADAENAEYTLALSAQKRKEYNRRK